LIGAIETCVSPDSKGFSMAYVYASNTEKWITSCSNWVQGVLEMRYLYILASILSMFSSSIAHASPGKELSVQSLKGRAFQKPIEAKRVPASLSQTVVSGETQKNSVGFRARVTSMYDSALEYSSRMGAYFNISDAPSTTGMTGEMAGSSGQPDISLKEGDDRPLGSEYKQVSDTAEKVDDAARERVLSATAY